MGESLAHPCCGPPADPVILPGFRNLPHRDRARAGLASVGSRTRMEGVLHADGPVGALRAAGWWWVCPMAERLGPGSVAVALVLALVGLPLVPPPHVHRAGIESRSTPVVHSHVVVDAAQDHAAAHEASLTLPHGRHANAVFLISAFDRRPAVVWMPVVASRHEWTPPVVTLTTVPAEPAGRPSCTPSPPDPVRGPPAPLA